MPEIATPAVPRQLHCGECGRPWDDARERWTLDASRRSEPRHLFAYCPGCVRSDERAATEPLVCVECGAEWTRDGERWLMEFYVEEDGTIENVPYCPVCFAREFEC